MRSLGLLHVFAFLFVGLVSCEAQRPTIKIQFTNPDGKTSPELTAELALTPSEQQLGLMYRKELPETQSMLFVFPGEGPRTFWMKNTYLELDMIFLDKNLRVVSVVARATPLTETGRESVKPAQYCLEIGGGLAAKWGIAAGSTAKVEGKIPTIKH